MEILHLKPPWIGGTKVCSRHLGHMTRMAATPIYGKNPSKSSSPEPEGRFHETVDFSETIAASDLKVSRSRHLLEYMKVCEY